MRLRSILLAGIAAALALGSGGSTTRAESRFEYLFRPDRAITDNQFFLNLTVSNFGIPRPEIEPVLPRLRSPEVDLPVVLFLAHESGRPVESIGAMRGRGLPWVEIFPRVGVPFDVLFVGIDRDPGPPYGRAWGYWQKKPKGFQLYDREIVALVNLQIGGHVCHASPFEIVQARSRGVSVVTFVADKHGRKHGHGDWQGPSGHGKKRPHVKKVKPYKEK